MRGTPREADGEPDLGTMGEPVQQTADVADQGDLPFTVARTASGAVRAGVGDRVDRAPGRQRSRRRGVELDGQDVEFEGAGQRQQRARRQEALQLVEGLQYLCIALAQVLRAVEVGQEELHRGSVARRALQVAVGIGEAPGLERCQLAHPLPQARLAPEAPLDGAVA